MKFSNKLIYSLAGLMTISSSLSAQEDMRQLKHVMTNDSPKHVNVMRAPSTSSYQTTIVGFIYYADSWNDLDDITPMGIYTVETTPGSKPEQFARIGFANSHCNGGAVLADDTYWYIWRQTDPSGMSDIDISQLYSYNIKTGEFMAYGVVSSELASTSDKSWDPTENKIYGQYTIDNSRKLCVVDYKEQTITPVGDCYTYYGLAFDGNGQLWGIDSAGDLYKVNKHNGQGTRIGSTGVVPKYSQSMAFDFKTNDLYWASYTDAGKDSSNLYKVNTSTGELTLITAFTDQEEFVGLGVMPATAADDAPGYVANLTVTLNGASADGNISFVLPEYTYMGDDLTGEISFKVLANGNVIFEGKGEKGDSINHDITLPTGDVTVSVVCSNAVGDGPAASVQKWVGEDYPNAPKNVRLELDDLNGKFSLSWDAVNTGVHGGYVDASKVTYTITRFPDKKVVATDYKDTSFTETLEQPQLPTNYYYEVKALIDWRESPEATESNHVPFGKGFEVPYTNRFDDVSSLDLFYITDGNGDGYTWEWSHFDPKTAYNFTGTDNEKPQDDWLITPSISMKAGNRYEVTYVVAKNMNNGKFEDYLETAFGVGVDPTTYTIAEERFKTAIGINEKRTVVITPQNDGYYHFGFHAVSSAVKGLSIAIDDLHIDVLANEDAPAAVTNLTAKAQQGTAPVTIKFTTPTKNVKGEKLDAITKVDVFRNTSELVKSVEVTETGKQMTVVDNKGARGLTKYTVVAYNEFGVGDRATVEIFLGMDLPGAPTDVLLVDNGNGQLKLSWAAPKEGANGGYCDPNNLVYNIYYNNNGFCSDFKKGLRGNETLINAEGYYGNEQILKLFAVAAENNVGEGYLRSSTEVIIGNAYKYPFVESWISGNPKFDMWYRMNSGANGWIPEANYASDNDGGCMAFDAADTGDMSYFCLGKVDMTNAGSPKLIFDYYAIPGADMSITPEINLAFNGEFKVCSPISFKSMSGEEGWREAVIDLAEFKMLPYITVRFLGVADSLHPLRVDNVRIMDSDKQPNLGFSGIGDLCVDAAVESVYYNLNGIAVDHPQKGSVYIIRYSNGKTHKVVY